MIYKRIKQRQLQYNIVEPGVKILLLTCANCLFFLSENNIVCKMGMIIFVSQYLRRIKVSH